MRALLILVAAAGCGRFGFDDRAASAGDAGGDGGGDAGGDAAADGPSGLQPRICNPRAVATLPLAGGVSTVAIRAVALSDRYAIAVETTAVNIWVVELDATGAFVAFHQPFTPGYSPLHGMSRLADRPIVGLDVGARYFLKLLDPGWAAYTTGPSGDPAAVLDPPIAAFPGHTSAAVATLAGGVMRVGVMSADGQTVTTASYQPAGATGGSFAATPSGARVVAALGAGSCETFFVSPAGTAGPRHTFGPCFSPTVAALDDTTAMIVHRTSAGGPYAVHAVPATATDAGATQPLTGATYARITTRAGAYWIGHGGSTSISLRTIAGGVATESTLARPTYPFDFTEREVFWIEGPVVYAAALCEQ